MQITAVLVLVCLSIILFEVFPEKSIWSIPVRQADEHMIAVPASGGFSFLLMQKQEAYKTTKDQQRFWKRILIVDDEADVTITFKTGIEDTNKGVKVRILTPEDELILETTRKLMMVQGSGQAHENIGIRYIQPHLRTKVTIIIVDRKYSLAVELKDDTKQASIEAIGMLHRRVLLLRDRLHTEYIKSFNSSQMKRQ